MRWEKYVMNFGLLTLLFFSCSLISGWNVHDSIGINIKGYLNLGNSSWSRWDSNQWKLPWNEKPLVTCTLEPNIICNSPKILLFAAISRSPWKTLISTWVWPSAAVEKTCDFLVGMVVFLVMSLQKWNVLICKIRQLKGRLPGKDTSKGFNAQGKWSYIKQKHIGNIAG